MKSKSQKTNTESSAGSEPGKGGPGLARGGDSKKSGAASSKRSANQGESKTAPSSK